MNVECINPFLTSAMSAFATMLDCKLTRGTPYLRKSAQPEHEVSGVIGLSGRARGTVVLSLTREAALHATAAMLDEELPSEINADVTDAIGELTSIIAGGAKAQLAHLDLSVGLPTVITGKCHCVEFPKNVSPLSIPFECDWGRVTVEVGLLEEPVAAGAAGKEQCVSA